MFVSDSCGGVRHLPVGVDALCHRVSDVCPGSQGRPRGRRSNPGFGRLKPSQHAGDPGRPLAAELDVFRLLQEEPPWSREQLEGGEEHELSLPGQQSPANISDAAGALLPPAGGLFDPRPVCQVSLHDQSFNLPDYEQGLQGRRARAGVRPGDDREEANEKEGGELI